MAQTKRRRKTTRRTAPSRRPARRRQPAPVEPLLSDEAQRTVGGILLALFGLILLLALAGVGVPLGSVVAKWVGQLFGWAAWAVAAAALYFGAVTLLKQETPRRQPIGVSLIILGATGFLHLFIAADPLAAARDGRGGGLVGYGLSNTTLYALGSLGSYLIFLALVLAGIVVVRNRPLRKEKADPAEAGVAPVQTTPQRTPAPTPTPAKPAAKVQQEPDFVPRAVDSAWEQPPLSLLSSVTTSAQAGDLKRSAAIIEQTLANFGVVASVVSVNVGPTVAQYELRPDPGVKLNQITALTNDLALSLAAHPIRIEAPIPGKSTVGIEVPNQRAATVRLSQLLTSEQWKRGGTLPLALGLDVSGETVVADLTTMPHLLIAGATGSGKSVGINAILGSLLFTHSPKHLRLLLVDPKRVELNAYNDIPHLLAPVIVDPPKVINALKWLTAEMDRRYKLFQDERVRNIGEYNGRHKDEELPYLVVVIDELADLMMVSGKAVEAAIVRIAQLARATGIHLILATQRPSVDVITGLIKANFPSRIAFTVTSQTDSRTILDMGGAEKLLGRGDMLFLPGNVAKPLRVQSAFMETKEVKRLTDFLKGKGAPAYDESVTEAPQGAAGGGDMLSGDDEDPLYQEAKAEVIRSRKASASLLQRRLKVGYARAARLLDMLEENGVIGPGEGAKPREILVESDDF